MTGTFGNKTQLKEKSECEACPPGHYCPIVGIIDPAKLCDPGHYCISGVDVPNPGSVNNTGNGGLCPVGHFCPLGTSDPIPCSVGSFQSHEGTFYIC